MSCHPFSSKVDATTILRELSVGQSAFGSKKCITNVPFEVRVASLSMVSPLKSAAPMMISPLPSVTCAPVLSSSVSKVELSGLSEVKRTTVGESERVKNFMRALFAELTRANAVNTTVLPKLI